MALNWNWSEKCGEIICKTQTAKDTYEYNKIDLYEGNAYLIMIATNEEDNTYQLWNFFADKVHMNNCLGLTKASGHDNILNRSYCKVTELKINKCKNRHWKEIVSSFAQAFNNIKIEIYSEEENK